LPGKTNISWASDSWNPTTGCGRVSAGCDNCYAEALSLRFGWSKKPWLPENAEENVVLHPERLGIPSRWKDPRRIFVNSMSDLFHPRVPSRFINDVWMEMFNNPRHTFMVLTKRPKRLRDWTRGAARAKGWPEDEIWPDWMWVGTSIESREHVSRADLLRETPAAVRFISAEPLLGPLVPWRDAQGALVWDSLLERGKDGVERSLPSLDLTEIDWLIAGGESGSGYRQMNLRWASDLRDQCEASGTAFFMKQDSGLRPDQRGRIPDDLWVREIPRRSDLITQEPERSLF
jgi:protein gp37